MLGSPAVEIDFFRLKDEPSPKKLSDRRDIQGVISKINPELLKTAIASASANKAFTLSGQQSQTVPVYKQDSGSVQMAKSAAPLTIFYNGSVLVFDVSPDQVEKIIKLATESAGSGSGSKPVVESVKTLSDIQNPLGGVLARSDLPMSRKKSLRRFLEKRKERVLGVTKFHYIFFKAPLRKRRDLAFHHSGSAFPQHSMHVSVSPYAFSQGTESSH